MSKPLATVVVVDDDPDTVEFLCDYLRNQGLDVVSCHVGPQVATCIAQHAPDLLILDVDLGDMTGIDVFRAVRADSTTHRVPVIFFTGNANKLRRDLPDYQALDAAIVLKPDTSRLHALIHNMVHQHT